MTELASDYMALAARYRAFAANEAHGVSPSYERLALEIADSPEILRFIAGLPVERQQPNLLLGAARFITGSLTLDFSLITDLVRRREAELRGTMLQRTTQTNEPARCAVLLPLLAALPQPLALIEVGASAGLCLLPDRYGYDYGELRLAPTSPTAPTFRCTVDGPAPLPKVLPQIVWRAGLDLNPLDVESVDDMAWLDALVWPEQQGRRLRLQQAIAVARSERLRCVRGDLLVDLESLMDEAPRDATLVVFHTAVLAYVSAREGRARFADAMRRSRAVWISNEVPRSSQTSPRRYQPHRRAEDSSWRSTACREPGRGRTVNRSTGSIRRRASTRFHWMLIQPPTSS
jgi:hypothetical protein